MKYVRFCYSPFLCHLAEHCLACIFFVNSASKFYLLLENSILLFMLILTAPAKKETKLFKLHNLYTLYINKKLQKYSYLLTNLLKGQKVSNHFNKYFEHTSWKLERWTHIANVLYKSMVHSYTHFKIQHTQINHQNQIVHSHRLHRKHQQTRLFLDTLFLHLQSL